jgi:hypothetical protein
MKSPQNVHYTMKIIMEFKFSKFIKIPKATTHKKQKTKL